MAKQKIKVLRVAAKREGFRRAGRAFGRKPVDLPVDSLTKEEVKALKGEAALTVIETETEAEAPK